MNTFLQTIEIALTQTPYWVYIILIYCIFIGIKASHDSIIPIKKTVIMPIVFLYLSIDSLFQNFSLNNPLILSYVIAILLGLFLGNKQAKSQQIKVDKETNQLFISGSWMTLYIILAIFFSKYYFGYALAMDPNLITNTEFEIAMLSVSGITTGIMVGRTLQYMKTMKKGPWVHLKK